MATQMEVFAGRFESVDVAMISFVHEAELWYSSVKLAGFGGVSLKALRPRVCVPYNQPWLMQPPGCAIGLPGSL